ncbi:MAG: DUF4123 domain-containing protein [Pseudomonadota bacterium]
MLDALVLAFVLSQYTCTDGRQDRWAQMAARVDEDDYWTNLTASPPDRGDVRAVPALTVEPIEGVEPLTVPGRLHEILFGVSKGEPGPQRHVYAVLDAAKVPGLPEMMEASSSEHACLFQGQFEEEMGDFAPWLVELSHDDPLTRNVFTAGDAPWHLWNRAPGIIVGADAEMTAVRRHLRRFTRVQDRRGKWFMFRFWEADYLLAYLGALATTKQADFMGPIRTIVTIGPGAHLVRWGERS